MVSLELMAHLVTALPPHGRLVLVGDPDQLGPIQAGAVLGDVAAAPGRAEVDLVDWMERTSPREAASPIVHGVVRLTRNRRFGGRLADLSAAVRDGDEQRAVDLLGDGAPDGIEWIDDDPALLGRQHSLGGAAPGGGGHEARCCPPCGRRRCARSTGGIGGASADLRPPRWAVWGGRVDPMDAALAAPGRCCGSVGAVALAAVDDPRPSGRWCWSPETTTEPGSSTATWASRCRRRRA